MPSPESKTPPSTQPMRPVNVCGFKAVAATFARRPKCIQRLFFDSATSPRTGEMCSWLASERRIYRQVEPAELERIAGSVHHGGIVAATERPILRAPKFGDLVEWQRTGEPLLILDRIGNPHNFGAIVRTAAFFGFTKMLIQKHPLQAQPNDAAYRVAEGGMEYVQIYEVNALVPFVKQLRSRFLLTGTTVRGGRSLDSAKPPRAPGRPVALLLGNEETGLDPQLISLCELRVHIAGGGAIESLNVSAAAAILLQWVAAGRRTKLNPNETADAVPAGDQPEDADDDTAASHP